MRHYDAMNERRCADAGCGRVPHRPEREFGERRREPARRDGSSDSHGSRPASCPTSCPRRRRSERPTGASRRSRTRSPIAGSRSRARSTGRWSSTRSTRARRSSWPTSRTRTRRRGRTASRGSGTSRDALDRTISLDTGEKQYALDDEVAVLFVRPRGWHLEERHFEVDGAPISARCSTSGSTSSATTAATGGTSTSPSSSRTSRRDSGTTSSPGRRIGSASRAGRSRRTVLIETILAAFEMDEILYELREHSAGPQRGALGLHLQRDQEARAPPGVRAPRPRRRDDGRAVHALLLRAPREDVPPARRPRDGRDGGVHPLAARSPR